MGTGPSLGASHVVTATEGEERLRLLANPSSRVHPAIFLARGTTPL
jgi:hypothetical protein